MGYLIPKPSLYCLTHWDKGVQTFPKVISLIENVISWQEFELPYYDVTVQHIIPYAMEILYNIRIIRKITQEQY